MLHHWPSSLLVPFVSLLLKYSFLTCSLVFPVMGRATIYMLGLAIMFVCLLFTSGLGVSLGKGSTLGVSILLVVQTLVNMTTIDPACYPIVAETPSGRLRYKTITIGRSFTTLLGSSQIRSLRGCCPRRAGMGREIWILLLRNESSL